jgi:O-antigen chain-terminating methyltransferase
MKQISLYEFGGDEAVLHRMQAPWASYFRGLAPVLDIGCGRGIFLEILAAAGVEAIGLDHSEEAVSFCRQKGFQVRKETAHNFLAKTELKFGGIFCSHVIEHLAYDQALELITLCNGALQPGGVLLLVTPNPQDLAVISEVFWLDPTHVRPYPALLLRSMLQSAGFSISLEKRFLGDWRLVGRRHLPAYFLRRLLLGRYYGKPNTLILAKTLKPPS